MKAKTARRVVREFLNTTAHRRARGLTIKRSAERRYKEAMRTLLLDSTASAAQLPAVPDMPAQEGA